MLCLGRAAGPPLGSYLSENVWTAVLMGIIGFNIAVVAAFYKRLVPIRDNKYNKDRSKGKALERIMETH